jgi:mannuronan 5-epimerase
MQSVYASPECISYDSRNNAIVISCGNANLTDVYNALNATNPGIINKGSDPKEWFLNASIKVENNTNFYINSTDTSWLKINSTFTGIVDKEPNNILARGNLIIDSVKITSWDTNKNDYALSDTNGTIPRSYILVNYGNGTTNITNSELAYLGYKHSRNFGLTYYTGAGSIIKNNKIHDLWYGFYSDGFAGAAYNIIIEGNEFYKNRFQGIAPHSGSHHLTISNNSVHNNGRGIICSINCYNIIIESNNVFDNSFYGIILHNNVSHSTIANNIVYDNEQDQISLYDLVNNNSVHANKISNGYNGIRVSDGSSNNTINNNTIANSYLAGIILLKGASQNTITSNTINNSNYALLILDQNTVNNTFNNNELLNSKEEAIKLYKADNSTNKLENNTSYKEPVTRVAKS